MSEEFIVTLPQYFTELSNMAVIFCFMTAISDRRHRVVNYIIMLAADSLLLLSANYFNSHLTIIIFLYLLAKLILKNSWKNALTITLLVAVSLSIANNIAFALYSIAENMQGSRMLNNIYMLIFTINLSLIWAFFFFTLKIIPKVRVAMPYPYMLWFPLAMILVFSILLETFYSSNVTHIDEHGNMTSDALVKVSGYEVLGVFLVAAVCYFVLLLAYRKFIEYYNREKEHMLLKQQIDLQKNAVAEAKTRYDMISAVKHDIANHYSVLSGLISNGDKQKALAYLEKIGASVTVDNIGADSGNPVLDVLLSEKIREALNRNIEFTHCVRGADLDVDDYDLCVIVANALDNAIGAAQGGTISLNIHRKKEFVVITVHNTKSTNIRHGSGLGLKNIEAVVNKYKGNMDISETDNDFDLSILLNIPRKQ